MAGRDDGRRDGLERATIEGVGLGAADKHSVHEHVAALHGDDIAGDASDTLEQCLVPEARVGALAGGQHVELTDRAAHRHLSLQFGGDKLVGCNAVGWTEHVGVMRGLVEGQVRLGEWKDKLLADPTKLMDAYLAAAQGQGHWSGAADDRRRG